MPDVQAIGLEQELKQAFDGLQDALERASEATTALSALAPRVRAIAGVFDQIEAAVIEGRRQIAGASAAIGSTQPSAAVVTRPTLVVAASQQAPAPQPFARAVEEHEPEPATADAEADDNPGLRGSIALEELVSHGDELVSFRLEFESRPGPLDLRAVDDAISEHPAVRDIALLDYDGHKATLKVWVEGGTSPAAIQVAIRDRVRGLFSGNNDVTVVALEDAA